MLFMTQVEQSISLPEIGFPANVEFSERDGKNCAKIIGRLSAHHRLKK